MSTNSHTRAAEGTPYRGGELVGGSYRLIKRIGHGASGEVFRAEQVGMERVVAVKFLNYNASQSAEFVARFTREAQSLAMLQHPHIVGVYHLGRCERGIPFMACEWAEGQPLGASSLSEREVIEVALQLSSALEHAHAGGVVHRDLKPDNILCSRGTNGAPSCKILDFGLAKWSGPLADKHEQGLTRAGLIYGTPRYLSPEQAAGRPIDERADLYSLGVILYELLAGRLPFDGDGMAILVQHLEEKPPALRELAPWVSEEFADLVMTMLEKNPGERPQSAKFVAARLRRCASLLDATSGVGGAAPRGIHDAEKTWNLTASPLSESATALVPAREPSTSACQLVAAASVWETRPRLGRRAFVGACLVLLFAALSHRPRAVERPTAAASVVAASAPGERSATARPSPPQRAMVMAGAGYSLRITLPEHPRLEVEERVAIDAWGPDGHPLRLANLVVVFTDAHNEEHGFSIPQSAPGRYEFFHEFAEAGEHVLQILPENGELGLKLHFDVEPRPIPRT